jgi:hypothetical protein
LQLRGEDAEEYFEPDMEEWSTCAAGRKSSTSAIYMPEAISQWTGNKIVA